MGKKKKEEEKGGEGWIVSFADLMTLLFAVFVVLYGMKEEGVPEKVVVLTTAVREAFVDVPDVIPTDKRAKPLVEGKHVYKYVKGETNVAPNLKKFKRATNVLNVINKDIHQMKTMLNIAGIDITEMGDPQGPQPAPVSVSREDDGFRMKILSSMLYDKGEYRVDRKFLGKLKSICQSLKGIGRKVTVEGHTDGLPAKGEFSNWELSSLRAGHVARFFISECGFPPDQVSSAGFADTRPVRSNRTAEERALNRRIEIKVHYD